MYNLTSSSPGAGRSLIRRLKGRTVADLSTWRRSLKSWSLNRSAAEDGSRRRGCEAVEELLGAVGEIEGALAGVGNRIIAVEVGRQLGGPPLVAAKNVEHRLSVGAVGELKRANNRQRRLLLFEVG